jgi:hypothetical protein
MIPAGNCVREPTGDSRSSRLPAKGRYGYYLALIPIGRTPMLATGGCEYEGGPGTT